MVYFIFLSYALCKTWDLNNSKGDPSLSTLMYSDSKINFSDASWVCSSEIRLCSKGGAKSWLTGHRSSVGWQAQEKRCNGSEVLIISLELSLSLFLSKPVFLLYSLLFSCGFHARIQWQHPLAEAT